MKLDTSSISENLLVFCRLYQCFTATSQDTVFRKSTGDDFVVVKLVATHVMQQNNSKGYEILVIVQFKIGSQFKTIRNVVIGREPNHPFFSAESKNILYHIDVRLNIQNKTNVFTVIHNKSKR